MKLISTIHPVLNGCISVMVINPHFVYKMVNMTAALTFISPVLVHIFQCDFGDFA